MRLTLTALIRKVGGDGIETGVPKWSRVRLDLKITKLKIT